MQTFESELVEIELGNDIIFERRRKLLPWWIKIFTLIFIVSGVIVPLALMGFEFRIAIYGFGANTPLSLAGVAILFIIVFKCITAVGLWTERDWAITFGQIDATLGIIICICTMDIFPLTYSHLVNSSSFRLELVLLIPFFMKLSQIKNDWLNAPDKQNEF